VSYVIRRVLLSILSVAGVVVVTFLLSRVVPGDPAVLAAGRISNPRTIEGLRKQMGLDKPLYQQFFIYIKDVIVRQDLGRSLISKRPVMEDLKAYFPATLEVVSLSMILITLIGIATGVLSAVRQNRLSDHVVRGISLAGISMPEFWFAIMMQFLFAWLIAGFPVDSRVSTEVLMQNPLKRITGLLVFDSLVQGNWPVLVSAIAHLVLPVMTLTFTAVGQITRVTRAAMLEVLSKDYIRTARAAGMRESRVVFRYALKNALIPVLTMLGMVYGFLLGGDVLIEAVFSWPGLGRYAVQAISRLDYPAILGVTLLGACIVIFLNLAVDLLYAVVDPSIEYD
jgi:peptide/nickel transport system permease protein